MEEEAEEEEEEEEEEGRTVLGRRLAGMCRVCQRGADSCFPLCFFVHPTKWRRHRTATEEIPNLQKKKQTLRGRELNPGLPRDKRKY